MEMQFIIILFNLLLTLLLSHIPHCFDLDLVVIFFLLLNTK